MAMASSLPGSNQRWGAACVQIRLLSALAIVTLVLPPQCVGYNNGLGRLPALGWNGWCTDGPCQRDVCYEKTVLEIADAMISSGMHKLGWEYINLDDCWGSTERAPDGSLQANATRFPSGIPSLAKQIHDKGLKLGLYTASGTTWCMHPWMQDGDRHIPGMWGHYAQDVATLVSFDIDYLKLDWCVGSPMPDGTALDPFEVYPNVSKLLNESGRQIWFSACAGYAHPKPFVGRVAAQCVQSWRTGADHHDVWNETALAIASMVGQSAASGPYGWNDFDFIHTGGQGCGTKEMPEPRPRTHCPGQTDVEYRTEMTMWVIAASPLLVSTDIRAMTPIMKDLLLNPEVIAVHQDALGKAGDRIAVAAGCAKCEVWARPLSGGALAVAMYNAGNTEAMMSISISELFDGAADHGHVRDLWQRRYLGELQRLNASVASHGVQFLKVQQGARQSE